MSGGISVGFIDFGRAFVTRSLFCFWCETGCGPRPASTITSSGHDPCPWLAPFEIRQSASFACSNGKRLSVTGPGCAPAFLELADLGEFAYRADARNGYLNTQRHVAGVANDLAVSHPN